MLARLHTQKDFFAGVMFLAIGVIAIYETSNLPFGTLSNIGPGFFPVVLSSLCTFFGALIVVLSLLSIKQPEPLSLSWRPIVLVAATISFGVLIAPFGFVPSLVVLVAISSLADSDLTWLDTFKLAVGLTIGSVIVFVYLLKQPIELFGPYLMVL
ncbi:tripartite tricarboxylate transporter TctB family protein [Microvirga zambiensis]|uniref:tripartite tricarboxylate transporter TctB family protein n=1 Tax=Microvirga zambiensis TaxID=1402137 RepID=UPI00191CB669|nr:tripartite tricarboxylate transporter TctB family protein [Microvirga zambiensis]